MGSADYEERVAPLLCAGVTAYCAIKKAALVQTGRSLINSIGCGGVGMYLEGRLFWNCGLAE
jgi:D-arabinose 1-dehydrogenase-like Zn-dependent alcohol dehydrogenase